MQDLFQNYVDNVNKLRDAFHDELAAQAQELSKAMVIYAQRSEAALASFMEKVSARGVEVEAAAAVKTRSVSRSSCKRGSAGCR